MTEQVTRDDSPVTGYHYRLDTAESAVEVDLQRLTPLKPEVLVELFGRRDDGSPGSVAVAIPLDKVPSLTGALMDAYRKGRDVQTKAQAAEELKTKGPFK